MEVIRSLAADPAKKDEIIQAWAAITSPKPAPPRIFRPLSANANTQQTPVPQTPVPQKQEPYSVGAVRIVD